MPSYCAVDLQLRAVCKGSVVRAFVLHLVGFGPAPQPAARGGPQAAPHAARNRRAGGLAEQAEPALHASLQMPCDDDHAN